MFDDIKLKLDSIHNLPDHAGLINFIKDFGDTAALMLTVASPRVDEVEIALRAKAVRSAIGQARSQNKLLGAANSETNHAAFIVCLPHSIGTQQAARHRDLFAAYLAEQGLARDPHPLEGSGFIGFDAAVNVDDAALLDARRSKTKE